MHRCSALHNTIVKHRWQASGHDLATRFAMTRWKPFQFLAQLNATSTFLAVIKFLQLALHPQSNLAPHEAMDDVFSLSCDLTAPRTMRGALGEGMGEIDRVALYLTGDH